MRNLILIFVLATVMLTGLIVFASTDETPTDIPTGPRAAQRSPMVIEIDTMLGEQDLRLEKLYSELDSALDAAAALEVQRKIEAVKRDSERSMLQIQLDYARVKGTPEQVTALEKALADFDDPRERFIPADSTPGESGDAR
jgi:hypothetical protein